MLDQGEIAVEKTSQAGILVLAGVALIAALYVSEPILGPVVLALVFGIVLSPISDFWDRIGLPPTIGALISLLGTLVIIGLLALIFQPLVVQLVAQAPKVWSDMSAAIEVLRGLLRGLSDVSKELAGSMVPDAQAQEAAAPSDPAISMPQVSDALFLAPAIAAQMLIFAGTLFFFVMTRTEVYVWAARYLSAPTERSVTARRLRDAERQVARYFLTITLINAGLGVATTAALTVIGLPDAPLWGVVVFVMNFVPYLGPAMVALSLLFAGVAAFDHGMSVLPAAAYVGLNSMEGQFVTPALVGRTLSVNPLLVFLALVFGLWLWGAIGGIVAIPVLLWVLVITDVLAAPAARKDAVAA